MATKALIQVSLYESARDFFLKTCKPTLWKQEVATTRFYELFVSKGSLVFDVGANRGHHTRCFLALGASVIAVEPLPEYAAELRMIYARGKVTVVPCAVGDRATIAELHIGSHSTLSTLSNEWLQAAQSSPRFKGISWKETISVPVVTLDSLIEKYGMPDFLKIDVEGFEAKALDGLSTMPRALCFEFNTENQDATIACLQKRCFPSTATFNYITGEPSGAPLLPQWVSADEMISIMKTRFGASNIQGDILVLRD
jgi:FkbM family methyltransferase